MTSKAPTDDDKMDGVQSWDASTFLQRVTAIAPSVIYVFNQVTQSNEYSNRELAITLGYSAQEVQDMGENLMPKLIHPDDLPKLGAHFAAIQAMQDGEAEHLEYRIQHRDGHWVWLLSHDTVFDRQPDGSVKRHIGVATDITTQKEAEQRILFEKRAADAANEELQSFAYSVSHDMKSPSNTMHMILTELLETQSEHLDEGGHELVTLGLDTVTRMQSLIDDVLLYTRVIGEDPKLEQVNLTTIVSSVLADTQAEIIKTGAVIDVGPLPIVRGNETHLKILVANLLVNALKYVGAGVIPHIRIWDCSDAKNNCFDICIKDNGIGIPKDAQARIFSMFKRLHLQEDYDGTGLGLAICRRVATSHGGSIQVESDLGQGSCFTLTLPRH